MSNYILVIDKNTEELRRLRELLSREGYNIMTASDIATATEICEKVPVSLVLGDSSLLKFLKRTNNRSK
jgi:PleD family two-component response regulator